MTPNRRTVLFGALLVAVVMGSWLLATAPPVDSRGSRGVVGIDDPDGQSLSAPAMARPSNRLAPYVESVEVGSVTGESSPRHFRVVDSIFGFAIESPVWTSGSETAYGDEQGWIELSTSRPVPGELRAVRYRPLSLASLDSSSDEIGLVPEVECGVSIRWVGAPAVADPTELAVRFEPILGDQRAPGSASDDAGAGFVVERSMGPEGSVSVPGARALHVQIQGPGGKVLGADVVRPGEHRVIELPSRFLAVQVADAQTEEPLEGVEFAVRAGSARDAATMRVVSDGAGRLRLSDLGGGLELKIIDPYHRLVDRATPGWRRVDRTTMSLLPGPGPDAVPTIHVHPQRAGIRMVDAASGALILGPTRAYITNQPQGDTIAPGAVRDVVNNGGMLQLPALTEGFLAMRGKWARIQPQGYRPEVLEEIDSIFGPEGVTRTVRFHRAPLRSFRLLDAHGSPFRHEVHVQSGDGRERYLSGTPGPDGILGPLTWTGDELVLWRFPWSAEEPTEEGRVQIARFSVASIEAVEVLDALVDLEQASVRVTDVPAGCGLWLMERDGGLRRPLVTSSGERVFEDVLPGEVLVGPLEWIRQLESRRFYRAGVETARVRPGAEVVIPYDNRWFIEQPLSGVIRLPEGAAQEVDLVPVYASLDAPLPFYQSPPGLALNDAGEYTIPQGAPRPDGLLLRVHTSLGNLVATTDDRNTLAVLKVGGAEDPQLGALGLRVTGAPATQTIHAQWNVEGEHLPVPRTRNVAFTASWRGDEELSIPCIPAGSHRIELRCGSEERSITVDVRAGRRAQVILDWESSLLNTGR